MNCPDTGTLRAWLDGEADVPAAHVEACASCGARVTELRAHAGHAAAAVGSLAPPRQPHTVAAPPSRQPNAVATLPPPWQPAAGAVQVAPQRPVAVAESSHAAGSDARPVGSPAWRRWQRPAAAAAAAMVAVALLVTPTGQTAFADFLAAFRSERFAVIAVQPGDGEAAAGVLDRLGTREGGPPTTETVADVAAAEAATGMTVAVPDPATLPAGTVGTPEVTVAQPSPIAFRFDAAMTRSYLDEIGSDVAVPDGFDGARLTVTTPPGVLLDYSGTDRLVVAQAGLVTADVEGDIGLEALRSFLLDLPGFPPEIAQQLRAIDDWRQTLPLPVPVDAINLTETTIAGGEGLTATQPGFGTVLLWQRDGRITVVAGSADEAALRRVADSL